MDGLVEKLKKLLKEKYDVKVIPNIRTLEGLYNYLLARKVMLRMHIKKLEGEVEEAKKKIAGIEDVLGMIEKRIKE